MSDAKLLAAIWERDRRISQLELERAKTTDYVRQLCEQIAELNDKVADWSVRAEIAERLVVDREGGGKDAEAASPH